MKSTISLEIMSGVMKVRVIMKNNKYNEYEICVLADYARPKIGCVVLRW